MPPAALVSTMTRQPAAMAVRTPWTTAAGECPSYRWVRPRNTSSRRPEAGLASESEVAGETSGAEGAPGLVPETGVVSEAEIAFRTEGAVGAEVVLGAEGASG